MNKPMLVSFKKTSELFLYPWNIPNDGKINGSPIKNNYNKNSSVNIDEINLWEEIYHSPGNIGIYAAFDPHVDFYIFVYYPLEIIHSYQGNGAIDSIRDLAKLYNVHLNVSLVET